MEQKDEGIGREGEAEAKEKEEGGEV